MPRRLTIVLIIVFIFLFVFVITGCSQLSSKQSTANKKFSVLIPDLTLRYAKLATAIEIAENVGGDRDVTIDGREQLKKYEAAKKAKNVNKSLESSRELEIVIARLRANAQGSPRLSSSVELSTAIDEVDKTYPGQDAFKNYYKAVDNYEDARTSWRNLLSATVGGYSSIGRLELAPVSEQTTPAE